MEHSEGLPDGLESPFVPPISLQQKPGDGGQERYLETEFARAQVELVLLREVCEIGLKFQRNWGPMKDPAEAFPTFFSYLINRTMQDVLRQRGVRNFEDLGRLYQQTVEELIRCHDVGETFARRDAWASKVYGQRISQN